MAGGGTERIVWLYAKPREINDATGYYVETIGLALARLGYALEHHTMLGAIPPRAPILTIDCKRALFAMGRRPGAPVWLWVQGLSPEEAALQTGDRIKKAYWTWFERLALPRARGVFMVSDAMRRHYGAKYGFDRLPVIIMPCINQALEPNAFAIPKKYTEPRFVYAGSLRRWQCFDETLAVFKLIRELIPHARMTVFTGEQPAARARAAEMGISDLTIDYVPATALQAALQPFKYGFVLRDEHVVNAVATPTKVSSYLAAGVIPITTRAVHDYAVRLGALDPLIMNDTLDVTQIAERVLALEARDLRPEAVLAAYRQIFATYFDRTLYLDSIADFFEETGLPKGVQE